MRKLLTLQKYICSVNTNTYPYREITDIPATNNLLKNKMKTAISLQLILKDTQMRIAMNKMCHAPNLYRLAPALLLFSFLIAGCAGSPSEVRYDDRMRTTVSAEGENAKTSTAGQYDKATAHYIIRPGNRPDFAPRDKRIKTESELQKEREMLSQSQNYPSTVPDETGREDLQMVLEVSDILFEFDKWVIKADVVPELDKWANYFQNNPDVTAEIYGHADSTGPSTYNQDLSVKRAQAVVNYLAEKGINPNRFKAMGFGESKPAVSNTTNEGRQKNRRVELNF